MKRSFDGSWINPRAKPFSSSSSNKLYKETATLARLMEIITTKNADFGTAMESIKTLKSAHKWYTSGRAIDIVEDYADGRGLGSKQKRAVQKYLRLVE